LHDLPFLIVDTACHFSFFFLGFFHIVSSFSKFGQRQSQSELGFMDFPCNVCATMICGKADSLIYISTKEILIDRNEEAWVCSLG
jgi:hypothetical protein